MTGSEKLQILIKEGEGLTVEFKERFTSRINEDIVAFANTKGGVILLGVRDDKSVIGEKLTNDLKGRITSIARNCNPSVPIKIKQVENIVLIEVPSGEEKPYSCSAGFFRRLDAVTQKMTTQELRLMFHEHEAIPFEEKINKEIRWEDISREKMRSFLEESHIEVKKIAPETILQSLNLARGSRIMNAGVLFFAANVRKFILQAQMTLIAFKGTDRIHIYDRKDVRDDLLTQFNEAILFLKKHLNVRSEIRGVNREDIYEIPLEALREAVANAIIHRDYSVRGTSLMVEVHEDKVVIVNPGGLPVGLTPADLINVSIRRNELIADMFARMDKVERVGTGIRRMRDVMKDAGLTYPEIKSDLFFTITFKRLVGPDRTKSPTQKTTQKTTQKILDIIGENPTISRKELAQRIGNITENGIKYHLARLVKLGKLKRIGPDKGGRWQVVTSN